jgi:prevent-host-death family protein
MRSIRASEFKAKCLAILDEVERTGEPVTILKRGRPVARLLPPALIVASARVLGATLLTRDGRIIDSALVPTVS